VDVQFPVQAEGELDAQWRRRGLMFGSRWTAQEGWPGAAGAVTAAQPPNRSAKTKTDVNWICDRRADEIKGGTDCLLADHCRRQSGTPNLGKPLTEYSWCVWFPTMPCRLLSGL
jgi:hypothetical protein